MPTLLWKPFHHKHVNHAPGILLLRKYTDEPFTHTHMKTANTQIKRSVPKYIYDLKLSENGQFPKHFVLFISEHVKNNFPFHHVFSENIFMMTER